jgi:hypothetical protein
MTIKITLASKSDLQAIRKAAKASGLLPSTWARVRLLEAVKRETKTTKGT